MVQPGASVKDAFGTVNHSRVKLRWVTDLGGQHSSLSATVVRLRKGLRSKRNLELVSCIHLIGNVMNPRPLQIPSRALVHFSGASHRVGGWSLGLGSGLRKPRAPDL